MAMLRFRRYRVFMICAFIILVLLYHVSQNSQWEPSSPQLPVHGHAPVQQKQQPVKDTNNNGQQVDSKPPRKSSPSVPPAYTRESTVAGQQQQQQQQPTTKKEPTIKIPQLKTSNEVKGGYGLPTAAPTVTRDADAKPTTVVAVNIPDRRPGSADDAYKPEDGDEEIHAAKPPAKYHGTSLSLSPSQTEIHWQKPTEWFPVPEESLIMLPTGQPKPIPTIQYQFEEESAAAKEKRELRLAKVKAEAQRAWSGYKEHAWMHDELRPISKKFKDPFAGWAATLVDSLDTLWIMGMREEFEDAVAAVRDIDFTFTPYRNDIPVFETVIRYLGGLLGAYDVSGGHDGPYRILLDKATELGEILMSTFDTPNRMPLLYYMWKPAYNENPKRASTSAGVAELGSLSMEFTRLAQLTGKNKYYDAVARITDALEELQNRPNGTALPGIFPTNLDASGCNRTAPAPKSIDTASEAAQKQAEEAADLEEEPKGYEPAATPQNHVTGAGAGGKKKKGENDDLKADLEFSVTPGMESIPSTPKHSTKHADHNDGRPTEAPAPFNAKGLPVGWDCVPQNLTSGGWGMESYSMGGSQDSTYEYFPKQYLLLGGLEPKYREMHLKTVAAVKKYLLFRPMAEGDPDILFSAKAFSRDGTDNDLTFEWEVTHLTCFLGGMFGMGGKIFNSAEDVEIGKKLAAGCAWAYDVFPTGIMPEFAQVLPCTNTTGGCHWNETAWYERLDPSSGWRDSQMEDYYVRKAEWEHEVEQLKQQEVQRKLAIQKQQVEKDELERKQRAAEDARRKEEAKLRPKKRGLAEEDNEINRSFGTEEEVTSKKIADKVNKLEKELDINATPNYQQEREKESEGAIRLPNEPVRPLTHLEYVANRIKTEHLPPGFVALNDRRYILRPEAIESVWYMYRITGDPVWQERGWRMFEAVVKYTQTEVGHSAIDDVGVADEDSPPPRKADSMESFWLAETLKYFYLLFAEPDVISLDDWVFNTEAHPFRRPKP
ncbi:glycosyl hydrolase family 47-domain-containing protein [Diplogelasinospora grovesii]|uniref:alpha-1,2-Mannosidase n=1 Tax=Diplogelasinospora grovesii TaxID=303347 RepID=A0AAN6N8U7_9PEZI|nr:glycosyl hydrolase family 47-domain-containing protein [Diplogelasinospora grovesii]